MNIGNRIKQRRLSLGMSVDDLAIEVNKNRATIYRYEKGEIENLPTTVIEPLAKALETTPEYLMGWTDDPRDYENDPSIQIPREALKMGMTPEKWAVVQKAIDEDSQHYCSLPHQDFKPVSKRKYKYLGEIACGEPIFADEQYETYIELDSDIHADFVLKAKGDSMINARIHDGDIVFIKEQPDVNDGEIAAVIIDDEATLKRVYKFDDYIMLNAENPAYKPIQIQKTDAKNVRIIGKAISAMIYL